MEEERKITLLRGTLAGKVLKYKYICLCGNVVLSTKDNLKIYCNEPGVILHPQIMRTMGMVRKLEYKPKGKHGTHQSKSK